MIKREKEAEREGEGEGVNGGIALEIEGSGGIAVALQTIRQILYIASGKKASLVFLPRVGYCFSPRSNNRHFDTFSRDENIISPLSFARPR